MFRVAGRSILVALCAASLAGAQEVPDWVARIRPDHPRLFFNTDTWPEVRARAEGPLAEHLSLIHI